MPSPARTYGWYHAEVLAAVANALILTAVSGYIMLEAWRRLSEPVEVTSGLMLAIAPWGAGDTVARAIKARVVASAHPAAATAGS